ncbi:hypothetical protein [Nocardia niwae]|uniref:hypothetical protein n=1 Tax=Nocardia niwae TaxID=626084 RepID=UPI0007A3851C|nr:hypothetical protein [Nocardia niwae]
MPAVTIRVSTTKTAIRPSDGARVVLVPTPGPPGPAGEIAPEDMEQIADDAADQVLADLEPPVTLTLLFENGLA